MLPDFDKTFRLNTRPVKSRVTYHCINDVKINAIYVMKSEWQKLCFVKSLNILYTATFWIGEPCFMYDISSGDRLARLIKQFLTNVVRFDGHEKWACTTPTFILKVGILDTYFLCPSNRNEFFIIHHQMLLYRPLKALKCSLHFGKCMYSTSIFI